MQEREEIHKIIIGEEFANIKDKLSRQLFDAMGGNAQIVEWSHTHNMNDYKNAGTYRIKGQRTGNILTDNLPIMNSGSGHTIEGILYVLDSSLPNGSGNSDDCTITQFLMLSNRVGGQEGDTYMRSAYGPNKDVLTWKPWEKYQTNVEVGAVNNNYTLNPSNPTQAISYGGMNQLTDNGIYSGIYLPPKAMIGTPSDGTAFIQDAAAIETFVMVVINNYAAAKEARCVTQIKFAVTNGKVFSMEKRTSTSWGNNVDFSSSNWESVGGGGQYPFVFNNGFEGDSAGSVYFGYNQTGWSNGTSVVIGNGVKIGRDVKIGNSQGTGNVTIGTSVEIGNYVDVGDYVNIGSHVDIGDNVVIRSRSSVVPLFLGADPSSLSSTDREWGILIGTGIRIWNDNGSTGISKDTMSSSILHIYHKDGTIYFYCNRKTASIQLT